MEERITKVKNFYLGNLFIGGFQIITSNGTDAICRIKINMQSTNFFDVDRTEYDSEDKARTAIKRQVPIECWPFIKEI